MPSLLTVTDLFPWITLGIALLIGVLVGAERETSRSRSPVGLRDLVLVSALGWLGGRMNEPFLTLALIGAVIAIIAVHRLKNEGGSGVTTEFSVVVVFGMTYVLGRTVDVNIVVLIVALAIAVTLILDAKASVKRIFSEVITVQELADIVRFLAIIFIIMPLLPDGRYGPYEFFNPRAVWISVILVTGVSFVGYFLEKFFGERIGTWLVAVLGGMVSTTVMTQTFARQAVAEPARLRRAWQAATLSNCIQFPRLLVLLLVAAPELASMSVTALVPAFVAGLGMSLVIGTGATSTGATVSTLKNPLRLAPAFQFAVFMSAVSFVGSFAYDILGNEGLYITSAVGALLDVDAIALTAADRVTAGIMTSGTGQVLIIIAVSANVIVKLVLARISGGTAYFLRMLLSFAVMIGAAVASVLIMS